MKLPETPSGLGGARLCRSAYRKMKKTIVYSAFALLAIVSIGCVSSSRNLRVESENFRQRTTQPEKVVLKTAGEAGQTFDGYVLVDGTERQIAGVSPAQFPLEASILIGEFRKTGGSGTLSFSIENIPRTRSVGFGALRKPGEACKFGYHDGSIETFSK